MNEILAMGGYGFYVWTSYIVFLVGLIGIIVGPLLRHRRLRRQLLATATQKHAQETSAR